MKIILSRKGFDSTTGEIASPIMPDGRLLSLPIPVTPRQAERDEGGIPYRELQFDGQPLDQIIGQLWNGRRRPFQQENAHLDPDLDPDRFPPRQPGWRRNFGQQGNAQTHLDRCGVGTGDLFLFFGWFKETTRNNGQLRYVRGARDLHVVFGWLHIGKILRVGHDAIPHWLHYHPHVVNADLYGDNNTIYVARKKLNLNGKDSALAGAGIFSQFNEALRLTAPDEDRRTHWRLPRWFYPFGNPPRPPLTYHKDPHRWTLNGGHVILESAYPGQEFVFDTREYPEAVGWIRSLFQP
jgi:hypothetical protein